MPDSRIEFLMQSIASHDRQIGELTDRIAEVTDRFAGMIASQNTNINKLVDVTYRLVGIVEDHQRRLDHLEGQ